MSIALLEAVNSGELEDDGTCVAVAGLIAAGVPEKQARIVVDEVAQAADAAPADETVADD